MKKLRDWLFGSTIIDPYEQAFYEAQAREREEYYARKQAQRNLENGEPKVNSSSQNEVKKESNVFIEKGQPLPPHQKVEVRPGYTKYVPYQGDNSKRLENLSNPIYQRPVYRKKINAIAIAIENSTKVNEHKDYILPLIKKIVEDNKEALFLFLRYGNSQKFFDVLDYEALSNEKVLENLLFVAENDNDKIEMFNALSHINDFLKLQDPTLGFEYKNRKYDVQNNSIIFIGTAVCIDTKDEKEKIMEVMRSIKAKSSVKAIKYFCMEDKETIDAAMLGFPIVGHIVSDFYK